MTRSESREVFVYDIAVRPDHQRKGIGRRLMRALVELATASGIENIFVLADQADSHAISFYRSLDSESSPVTCFTFAGKTIRVCIAGIRAF